MARLRRLRVLVCALLLLAGAAQSVAAQAAGSQVDLPPPADGRTAWTDLAGRAAQFDLAGDEPLPTRYRLLALDVPALEAVLAAAPPAGVMGAAGAGTAAATPLVLVLPLPSGEFQRFTVENSPVLAPALAADYPQFQTYRGRGLDDPAATLRLGLTPQGFHAIVLSDRDTAYITRAGVSPLYLSYYAADYPVQDPFVCGVDEGEHAIGGLDPAADAALRDELGALRPALAAGPDLRTYRLALAATGEYSADAVARAGLVNGSDEEKITAVLAAIVAQLNMVNAIFEREVALRFELVADNADVIFLDPAADPYTNDRMDLMLAQNRSTLDTVIGSANYDFGHALGTAGGGVAFIGVACNSLYKGGGVSGPGAGASPYTVMVIAHEMGHQFGAYHTFNARSGGCGNGNRSASSAFEPGSGSTIMSYSGLCGADQNLPGYFTMFHVSSFDQIVDYSRNRTGSICGVPTATGNQAPVVDAGPDYAIPAHTPFVLAGTAADGDGDPLTYSWHQVDLPSASFSGTLTLQQALTDLGTGPLYRVYPFSAGAASRAFPAVEHVLSGTVALGEVYPATNRSLNFRLFTRDNRTAGGGANYDSVRLTVIDTGAAFRVTQPFAGSSWPAGLVRRVQWNVAGTTVAPIGCTSVDILFSADGGATFPTVLAAGTPNDGTEWVTAPPVTTTTGRIQVRCTGSVFYHISVPLAIRPNTGSGLLAGTVRSGAGALLEGAQVSVAGADFVTATADAAGQYALQLPPGSYTLTVGAFGYALYQENALAIADGSSTTRDVTLTPLPLRTITGSVVDAGHGYPLYAALHFTDSLPAIWTDPMTGAYSVTVVEGASYTVTVAAWLPGYAPYTTVWQPVAGTTTFDIALEPEPVTCRAPGYQSNTGNCIPLPGGLLRGYTYGVDGAPLAGVTVVGGGGAVSSTVTADPVTPDSFYSLFLPTNAQTVTARAAGLPDISTSVLMGSGAVVRRDFDWQAAYTDATLQALALEGPALSPVFSPAVVSYSVTVSHEVTHAVLAFAVGQPGASVRFNGQVLPPNATTAAAVLAPGANTLALEVTALDGQARRTYMVTITRAAAPGRLYLPQVRK